MTFLGWFNCTLGSALLMAGSLFGFVFIVAGLMFAFIAVNESICRWEDECDRHEAAMRRADAVIAALKRRK